jgi:hypothetical protein
MSSNIRQLQEEARLAHIEANDAQAIAISTQLHLDQLMSENYESETESEYDSDASTDQAWQRHLRDSDTDSEEEDSDHTFCVASALRDFLKNRIESCNGSVLAAKAV